MGGIEGGCRKGRKLKWVEINVEKKKGDATGRLDSANITTLETVRLSFTITSIMTIFTTFSFVLRKRLI
jgi:hypothetical protein